MQRLHLALAVTLAGGLLAGCPKSKPASPSGAGGDTLTLPLARRTVGHAWTKAEDTSTILEVTADGQTVKFGARLRHRSASEALEVDGDGHVTRVAVTYPERAETAITPGGEETRPSAIVGKSYVAWLKDGKVAATHADGSEVSPEELQELTVDQRDLGKASVIEELMARTWKIGEKRELTADEIGRLAGDEGAGPRPTAMSFTLRKVEDGVAEFAMTVRLENQQPPFAIDASGVNTADARTGRPLRLDVTGPVSGEIEGLPVAGTMSRVVAYEYPAP